MKTFVKMVGIKALFLKKLEELVEKNIPFLLIMEMDLIL